MSFPRAASSAVRALRNSAPKTICQNTSRRGYSSGKKQANSQSGSDLPWLIGAIGVTAPATWYVLKASPEESHHVHMPHSPHGTEKWQPNDVDNEKAMAKDIPDTSDDVDNASKRKADDNDSSPSDDSATGESVEKFDEEMEEMKKAKPAENDYQGNNTIKHIPDDKGATKLRKDSTNAIKAGTDDNVHKSDDPRAPKDFAAAAKTAGGRNTMSGKQEKLSNTDTKHSRDIGPGSGLSQKGEGTPDSSKSKGTVDATSSNGEVVDKKEEGGSETKNTPDKEPKQKIQGKEDEENKE